MAFIEGGLPQNVDSVISLPRLAGLVDDRIWTGTGRVFPEKFTPPTEGNLPHDIFPEVTNRKAIPPTRRFVNVIDPTQFLVYTDGACLGNGGEDSRGGCSFVFKGNGHFSFRLEDRGPTGEEHHQTSNRAELRAVIASLQFRYWPGEGFQSIVIATDSEYIVEGATNWSRKWVRNNWKTRTGAPTKNRDLWETLLGEAERWAERDFKIFFWRIPREWNAMADAHAKDASLKTQASTFGHHRGVLV